MHTVRLDQPQSRAAFRTVQLLVGCYLGLSVLTLVAAVLLRNHSRQVNDVVWTRGTIVAVVAAVMFAATVRAAHGSRQAYRRVRIMSAAMVLAIVVLISLPGFLPLWMRIEQGVCGLVLLGVVALVNGNRLRSAFAPE